MNSAAALQRLLHLASPALPVGAFSYSQGLEWAVAIGGVVDAAAAARWIGGCLLGSFARCELPALLAMLDAWRQGDAGTSAALNGAFLASRESAELRAETVQMGFAMRRWAADAEPDLPAMAALQQWEEVAFPTAWSAIAAAWGLPADDAATAYAWSWLENQVMAAVKLVPLGQRAGQKLLLELGDQLPLAVATARQFIQAGPGGTGSAWDNFAPGLALASAAHETQYTRLFRS